MHTKKDLNFHSRNRYLEPVYCKKQQKKFLISYWFAELGTSEGPEWFQTDCIWVQVILLIIKDQFYTIQNLQRSPIPQISNWSGTFFFAFSYSKPTLGKLSKCRLESSNWHDLSCKSKHDSKVSPDHCTLAFRFNFRHNSKEQ